MFLNSSILIIPFVKLFDFSMEVLNMDKHGKWKKVIEFDNFIYEENDVKTRVLDNHGNVIIEYKKYTQKNQSQ